MRATYSIKLHGYHCVHLIKNEKSFKFDQKTINMLRYCRQYLVIIDTKIVFI